MDFKTSPPSVIAQVHVAELLAGIPWTSLRAREHVVNEISQTLHKVLIFNNNLSNPFQHWQEGKWFASWGQATEGEQVRTLVVCVTVIEQKVKPRKGQSFRWNPIPEGIKTLIRNHTEEDIAPLQEQQQWENMATNLSPAQHHQRTRTLRHQMWRPPPPPRPHYQPVMQGGELMIATKNTRCLGQGFFGRRKRKEIQHLFKHTVPRADIILLQETKLPEEACLKQARFIEGKGGTSLWNEASFSAQTGKYTGGTGIILSEKTSLAGTHHGILFPGRAQYVVINLSPRLQLGVINVYGFNDTGPRAMLWNHLAQVTLPDVEWVLAGDINNIESMQDKQGGTSKTSMGNRELDAWNRLLVRLGVRDSHHIRAFTRKSLKAFTWTNGRNDDSMVQSRINRIYIPASLAIVGGSTEILPEISDISDHSGVLMHFNNTGPRKVRQPFFNKGLLNHPESKAALVATWKEAMEDPSLDNWNKRVVEANKAILAKSAELTRLQKQRWRATYLDQFGEIIEAEEELQHNWGF